MPVPPMPAMASGVTALSILGIAGMAGSATFALLVVVMRLTGAGALMVCCLLLHLHLVLDGARGGVGICGGPAKVCLRLAWMVCTIR